jgi:5-bromo-4-chloroindolyl phosphate hydrolysis protein
MSNKLQSRKLWVAILGTIVIVFLLIFFKSIVTSFVLISAMLLLAFFWSVYISKNVAQKFLELQNKAPVVKKDVEGK